jgi:hypothetical protein
VVLKDGTGWIRIAQILRYFILKFLKKSGLNSPTLSKVIAL